MNFYLFIGTGRSKKSAKRAAAHAMLTRIRSLQAEGGSSPPVIEDSEEEDEIPLVSFFSVTSVADSFRAIVFHNSLLQQI